MTAPELGLTRRGNFCRAVGCATTIADHLLMCGPHWKKVPAHLQSIIYKANSGRLRGNEADRRRWLDAVRDAIQKVANKEGEKVRSGDLVGRLDIR